VLLSTHVPFAEVGIGEGMKGIYTTNILVKYRANLRSSFRRVSRENHAKMMHKTKRFSFVRLIRFNILSNLF